MKAVRIRFVNADKSLATKDSFLSRLTAQALGREVSVVSDRREVVDVQFTSVQFPVTSRIRQLAGAVVERRMRASRRTIDSRWSRVNPGPQGRAQAHIWYTGENVRPPSTGWDGSLSFDVDPLEGRNAYLPLWWFSVGLLGPAYSMFIDPAPQIDQLLARRPSGPIPTEFAVAFINNPDPVRFHAVHALSQFGNVDVFGRAVRRPLPNKATLAGRYKFVLCFENDLYPGYVTEKAIEAWGMGAIPLWWGSDPAGYLNPQAVLNAADFASLSDFAEAAALLAGDEDRWLAAFGSELLLRKPDLQPAMDVIRRAAA